jgi:hypothetical protein
VGAWEGDAFSVRERMEGTRGGEALLWDVR